MENLNAQPLTAVIDHLNGDPEGKATTFTNQQGAGVLVEEIGATHKIRILHWPV